MTELLTYIDKEIKRQLEELSIKVDEKLELKTDKPLEEEEPKEL